MQLCKANVVRAVVHCEAQTPRNVGALAVGPSTMVRQRTTGMSTKGGGLFEFQTPPPSPDPPPKVFEPVFLQFEILGERVGAKGANSPPPPPLPEGFFFPLCIYTQNTQNFVVNTKMFARHRKFFDPWPDLWV